ncbi:MAG: PAS domain-containing protein [Desulfovibrio sp.]|jgi:PAS domain S-box-containing protein|nr:PAS domain-containing protein [Desulfovibrio sp.]
MEIAEKTKERSTIILAVLTVLVIGCSVLFSTAQNFRQQGEAEQQHLYLTARAVYLSIEKSVRRGPVREDEKRLSPGAAEFFQALEQEGEVLFAGIVDDEGENFLTSPLHGGRPINLPDAVVENMLRTGELHGLYNVDGREVYLYGKRLEPLRGMPMSLRDALGSPGFLLVGLDRDKYLNVYAGIRRNLIFQAVYILAAALLTWGLGLKFLSRREQAGKAAALERFQAKLLDKLPDGLITVEPDGTVRSVNPAALSILGRSAGDVLGRPARDLPGECSVPAGEFFASAGKSLSLGDEEKSEGWRQVEYRGSQLEILALPLSGDRENAGMIILRDRTTLRNLEKSLAEAEKLAAVGALASGVAHEVRNPLSSLRGFAQYFVKKLAGRVPEEEYAKIMVREADRLNRVVTDLLFLGRGRALETGEVELPALMHEIRTLLRFDLERKGIDPVLRLDAEHVCADADSLKQMLLNLVLNSLDALETPPENKGTGQWMQVTGETVRRLETPRDNTDRGATAGMEERAAVPAPLSIVSGRMPGAVFIEVRDTGCGMSEEQKKRAFDAFFTTKERGTGLGLALVQRGMTDHGGSVLIFSEAGQGSVVRLIFPDRAETPRGKDRALRKAS